MDLRILLISLLVTLLPAFGFAQASVDTLSVYSVSMKKPLKVAITFPSSYKEGITRYPVLYLLHGGSGAFSDWHQKVTEKGLVNRMAEAHDLIIITPGVGPASYYYDSPLLDSVRYETYLIKELIPLIDQTYRTLPQKDSRAITGLSMGGHGAITLAANHPQLFVAAGSMSGVMNIDTDLWEVGEDFRSLRKKGQLEMLGAINYKGPEFSSYTAVGLVEQLKGQGISLLIDCGTDDFLIETNRQMHTLLLQAGIPHEYTERPGAHTWTYWTEALPVHLAFLNKRLKRTL
jgi:S-formylglutathione hydrolase FrmB